VFQGLVQRPRALAYYIETALRNCTHVIAVITPNTRGSMWVPYEYGRARDSSPDSVQAACWIDRDVTGLPEYLELGVKATSDDEIRLWLRQELAAWVRRFPATAAPAPSATAGPAISDKPRAIGREFAEGLGYEVKAPDQATFSKKPPLAL
jgi:hypothetical protein